MIEDEPRPGTLIHQLDEVRQFRGAHTKVKTQAQFAEQLNPPNELLVETVSGGRTLHVQHLPHSLDIFAPLKLLRVLRELLRVGPSGDDRRTRRSLAAFAEVNDVIRFFL